MNDEFDMASLWITELGKTRSDEYTERILAFVQEMEKSSPEPFIPLLTDQKEASPKRATRSTARSSR
jgi:hypothetical protein